MTRLSASFWAFTALLAALFAGALLIGGPDLAADRALLLALQQGALVPAARLVTRLGDWWLVFVAGGAAAALLAISGARRKALALVLLLLSERLLVEQLKLVFDRVRPDPAGHLIAVHTQAFPSGHAANAMALGLGLALLLPSSPRIRVAAVAAALLYAFAIGTTRLVLGVHWPSDVAGGWALGALSTLLLVRLAEATPAAPRD